MNIYIVNYLDTGYNAEIHSSYHATQAAAYERYTEWLNNVSIDRVLIELVCLNTATLEAATIDYFEGNSDDLVNDALDLEEANQEAAMWAAATAEALAQAKAKTEAGA